VSGDRRREVLGADLRTGAFIQPILLRCGRRGTRATCTRRRPSARSPPSCHTTMWMTPSRSWRKAKAASSRIGVHVRRGCGRRAGLRTWPPCTGACWWSIEIARRNRPGHGSPVPGSCTVDPDARGGEELGGLRPSTMACSARPCRVPRSDSPRSRAPGIKGAPAPVPASHPFSRDYETLAVGDTVSTHARTITLDDIEHFSAFHAETRSTPTWTKQPPRRIRSFRAASRMDISCCRLRPVCRRSFARAPARQRGSGQSTLSQAGLPGDEIRVRLTVKHKQARKPEHGEVRWDAEVFNQHDETVARYELLTMSARRQVS